MPVEYLLKIYRGDTKTLELLWLDEDGDPVDLTGYSAVMQLKEQCPPNTVAWTGTDGNGIVLGGAAGTIVVQIPSVDTASLPANTVYDLQLTNGPIVETLIYGNAAVREDVSPEV